MTKYRTRLMGAIVTLSLSLSTAVFAADDITIKVGHALSPGSSFQVATEAIASEVLAETNGRVRIEVFHSGQLGTENEMVDAIKFGALGGGVINSGIFAALDPIFAVTNLPFAWPTREQAYSDFDGKLGDKLEDALAQQGFVTLSWFETGYRHITNNTRPIRTLADMSGIKIRVAQDKIRLDTFNALNAEAAPLAFGELYSALEQGVFDGQENPIEVVKNYSLHEVQKYISLTGHVWASSVFIVSADIWEKVSKDDQAVIRKVSQQWQNKQREMINTSESDFLEFLKEHGMEVNEVDDIQPFKDAVRPVWDALENQVGADVVSLIGAGK